MLSETLDLTRATRWKTAGHIFGCYSRENIRKFSVHWPYILSHYGEDNQQLFHCNTIVESYHPEDGSDMFSNTSGLTRSTRCNTLEDIRQINYTSIEHYKGPNSGLNCRIRGSHSSSYECASSGIQLHVLRALNDVSEERIISITMVENQPRRNLSWASGWFLDRSIFNLEEGGDAFLRNVDLYEDYTAWYLRRWHNPIIITGNSFKTNGDSCSTRGFPSENCLVFWSRVKGDLWLEEWLGSGSLERQRTAMGDAKVQGRNFFKSADTECARNLIKDSVT
jgi:hypothetical protein